MSDCRHCGAVFESARDHSEFCCQGCAAAYQWINEAGLGAYYQWRSAAARTPVASADSEALPVSLSHFDHPELLQEHARMDADGSVHITLSIEGIRCAACAWLIEKALTRMPGVARCEINALTSYLNLSFQPQQVRLSQLVHRLMQLGYKAYLSDDAATQAQAQRTKRQWQLRLGVALIGAFQAMMFAEPLYLDVQQTMSTPTRDFLRWVTFLLSTPVVFFSGWPFLVGAWYELKARAPSMDSLISLSVLLAYFASIWECLSGGPHVYFDAAVMFVLLLLIARALEAQARVHARAGLHLLTRTLPAFVTRVTTHGAETVALKHLQIDDLISVRAGEVLPVDGELCPAMGTEAATPYQVDESALTGECTPVLRLPGSLLYAGSIACTPLQLRCKARGKDGWLMRLSELAQAQQSAPLATGLRPLAQYFAVAMCALAALVYLLWLHIAPERAFEIALAVLACSCPCAFALAIPAARQAAHSALVELGLLALKPIDLGKLARLRTAVFDKTGTLTENRLEVLAPELQPGFDLQQVNQWVCSLQADSTHPLARAMLHQARTQNTALAQPLTLRVWQEIPGAGVHASANLAGREQHARLGRKHFALGLPDDGAIWLALDGVAVASWQWRELLRPDAIEALNALSAAHLQIELLSGDHSERVEALAKRFVGIRSFAGMKPEQKLAHVQQLKAKGPVLMVGDGLNDAPVLAAADVAIAMSSAAALSLKQADFVLVRNQLSALAPALRLAAQARRVERQNLLWAISYNAVMLPFAAAGWVWPWQAALGMALSSFLVSANALRLRFYLRGERAKPMADDAIKPTALLGL